MPKTSKVMQAILDLKDQVGDAQKLLVQVAGTYFSDSEPGDRRMQLTADDKPMIAEEILEYLEENKLIAMSLDGTYEFTEEGQLLWES